MGFLMSAFIFSGEIYWKMFGKKLGHVQYTQAKAIPSNQLNFMSTFPVGGYTWQTTVSGGFRLLSLELWIIYYCDISACIRVLCFHLLSPITISSFKLIDKSKYWVKLQLKPFFLLMQEGGTDVYVLIYIFICVSVLRHRQFLKLEQHMNSGRKSIYKLLSKFLIINFIWFMRPTIMKINLNTIESFPQMNSCEPRNFDIIINAHLSTANVHSYHSSTYILST